MSAGTRERRAAGRRFALAPFGTHSRIIALAHARHLATVIAALLMVALTLDVAPRADAILAHAQDRSALGLAGHLVWYILLRLADLAGALLPLGSFLGLFWSEVTLTQTRERVVLWNGGRTPLQSLAPILMVGAVCGAVQVVSLMVLRPAAVSHQIATGLGSYGERFSRRLQDEPRWIVLEHHLVRARVDHLARRLVDVDVYELSERGRLVGRIQARFAAPAAGEPGRWTFLDGSRWAAPDAGGALQGAGGEANWFAEATLPLPLDPLWLESLGIDARYLPQARLADLAGRGAAIPEAEAYATWWHARIAQALLPLGMMMLASALCMTLVPYRTTLQRLLIIGVAGYLLHIAVSIFVWLGEYGQVHPILAAWFVPLSMISVALGLLIRLQPQSPPEGAPA